MDDGTVKLSGSAHVQIIRSGMPVQACARAGGSGFSKLLQATVMT